MSSNFGGKSNFLKGAGVVAMALGVAAFVAAAAQLTIPSFLASTADPMGLGLGKAGMTTFFEGLALLAGGMGRDWWEKKFRFMRSPKAKPGPSPRASPPSC